MEVRVARLAKVTRATAVALAGPTRVPPRTANSTGGFPSSEPGARLGGGQPPRLSPDLVGDGPAQLAARGQEVGDGRLRSLIDGKNDQIPVMGDTDVEGPDLLLSSRDELFDRDALTPGGQPQNQRHVGRQRGRVAGSQSLLSECGGPGRFAARRRDAQPAPPHPPRRPEHDSPPPSNPPCPAHSPG